MSNEETPLVSIVVPVYNGEDFLEEALRGIANQTYANWEAIIVDDCSTDATPDIARRFCDEDERFRYIRNEENKKLPASLNVGFRLAKGDFHTWTSDDNVFHPDALSTMLSYLQEHEDTDVVYCTIRRIDENGDQVSFPNIFLGPTMLHVYNVVHACFLYKSEVTEKLGGYDEDLFLVEDYDFWLRAMRYFKFHYINEAHYDYRVYDGTLTATRQRAIREKTREILSRELRCGELGLHQRVMALIGLAVNEIRIARLP